MRQVSASHEIGSEIRDSMGSWVVVTERGHGGSRDRKRGWIVGMLKAEQQRRLLKRRKSHACQPVLPCTGFFVLFYLRGHLLFTDVLFWGEGENDWLMKIRRNEGPLFKVSRERSRSCDPPRSVSLRMTPGQYCSQPRSFSIS